MNMDPNSKQIDEQIIETSASHQTFFHATRQNYGIGQAIHANAVVNRIVDWLEEWFENQRPPGAPSRNSALFAFDSPRNAWRFSHAEIFSPQLRLQQGNRNWRIFEVFLTNPLKAVTPIVDFLRRQGNQFPHIENAIQEYWNPQQTWHFFEYLSDEMQIIREIVDRPNTQQLAEAIEDWNEDTEQAKRIRPLIQHTGRS